MLDDEVDAGGCGVNDEIGGGGGNSIEVRRATGATGPVEPSTIEPERIRFGAANGCSVPPERGRFDAVEIKGGGGSC